MIRTVEAVVEPTGTVRLLEPITLPTACRALVTLLETENPAERERTLRDHAAFLNSYAPQDEGLYDDAGSR